MVCFGKWELLSLKKLKKSISGTILKNRTTPVSSVTITASANGGNFTAVTNATIYSLSLPAAGNYTVMSSLLTKLN